MRILFCGYRDWALGALEKLSDRSGNVFDLAQTPDELAWHTHDTDYELILVVGWSWKIPDEVLDKSYVVGMHPSDLPDYAGGSPLQNQILAGIEETNASLFRLTSKFDAGSILGKTKIDLRGHISDVFAELTRVTVVLLDDLVEKFPLIEEIPQVGSGNHVRRLKPEHSKLRNPIGSLDGCLLKPLTCKEMWDFIRCREDPYPNVYFEDETGRLVIKRVEFEPK